jgi:hypothetical protein
MGVISHYDVGVDHALFFMICKDRAFDDRKHPIFGESETLA